MYDGYTINLVLKPIFYVIENVLEINASIGKDSRPEFEKIRMCTENSKFCAYPKSALTKELNYASTLKSEHDYMKWGSLLFTFSYALIV